MRYLVVLIFMFVAVQAPLAHAIEISVEDDYAFLTGRIDVGDDKVFFQATLDAPFATVKTLALDSRGGDVYTAMQIGRKARALGLNTTTSGNCLSACTLIFISGVKRVLTDGRIGFHRILNVETGEQVALDDDIYNRLTLFAWGKGVDPIRFVAWMTYTNDQELYLPSDDALCRAQILKPCER